MDPFEPNPSHPAPSRDTPAAAPYWKNSERAYEALPSVRHRLRFFSNSLKRFGETNGNEPAANLRVLDFGCGNGLLLDSLQKKFHLRQGNLFGCDVDSGAVAMARQRLPLAHIHEGPDCPAAAIVDVVLCGEVIEHTPAYREVISNLSSRLRPGGALLLTTQSGRIHSSDRYFGHTQHFRRSELKELLLASNFEIVSERAWGFPFFWLQKLASDIGFEGMKKALLENAPGRFQSLLFAFAHALFFLQDVIPAGPQLYIHARKRP